MTPALFENIIMPCVVCLCPYFFHTNCPKLLCFIVRGLRHFIFNRSIAWSLQTESDNQHKLIVIEGVVYMVLSACNSSVNWGQGTIV